MYSGGGRGVNTEREGGGGRKLDWRVVGGRGGLRPRSLFKSDITQQVEMSNLKVYGQPM